MKSFERIILEAQKKYSESYYNLNSIKEEINLMNNMHSHYYKGTTSITNGHEHEYSGYTSMSPDEPGHIHNIEGTTTMKDGHSHDYNIQTIEEIEFDDSHYHSYQGMTERAGMHTHEMMGYTSLSI